MSLAIWKYEIHVSDEFSVSMPGHAVVIHVDVQRTVPCMWALVNPGEPVTDRTFYVRGTGHPVEGGLVHLGSFMLDDGAFVGHLFERSLARIAT